MAIFTKRYFLEINYTHIILILSLSFQFSFLVGAMTRMRNKCGNELHCTQVTVTSVNRFLAILNSLFYSPCAMSGKPRRRVTVDTTSDGESSKSRQSVFARLGPGAPHRSSGGEVNKKVPTLDRNLCLDGTTYFF